MTGDLPCFPLSHITSILLVIYLSLLADKAIFLLSMTSSIVLATIRVGRTRSLSFLLGLVFLELSGQKQPLTVTANLISNFYCKKHLNPCAPSFPYSRTRRFHDTSVN